MSYLDFSAAFLFKRVIKVVNYSGKQVTYVRKVLHLLVGVDIEQQSVGIQHDSVAASSNDLRDFTSSVDSLQVQETRLVLNSLTNKFCTLGFTLSANDNGLLLLSSLVNNESSSLCILLSNLLSFDSTFETGTVERLLVSTSNYGPGYTLPLHSLPEADMGNGNIIEDNVETESAANKVLTDKARHSLTLSDELRSVELSNN